MKNKKFLPVILSILLVLQIPVEVFAGTETVRYDSYLSGNLVNGPADGDLYTVVNISTEEDLKNLAKNCESDQWSLDKIVELKQDIVLSKYRDLMIPSFSGIFEGNGHCISDLKITEAGSSVGLFRYIQQNGRVNNLNVKGEILPKGSKNNAGGIAGTNFGCISRCSFGGIVDGDSKIGGIAGENEEQGEISGCTNRAIVSGNHSTGGIAGENHGVLKQCSNAGNINIHGKEVVFGLEDLDMDMEELEKLNSTENISVHTDSGGIAGISDGKIYYCINGGNIGYSHVGYNTGGIVGRLQQGYIQNCTNKGKVYGRKDVGGIAGQMEPFLEISYFSDQLQKLDEEMNCLFDLMDQTHVSVYGYSTQLSDVSKNAVGDLQAISQSGQQLSSAGTELWDIYNNEMNAFGSEIGNIDFSDGSGSVSGADLEDIKNKIDQTKEEMNNAKNQAANRISRVAEESNRKGEIIRNSLQIMNQSMASASSNIQQMVDILGQAKDSANRDTDALVAQAKVVRERIRTIRNDLFNYEGITVEDASDEQGTEGEIAPGVEEEELSEQTEQYYDTDSFQLGKITLCINQGMVEADTNVGGIVGQISTEYDFDPEDDISSSGTKSLNVEQSVKAVVRESRNSGDVSGKKDCIGGIVGKAEHGALISCESYGDIKSSHGDYVGGIAGLSENIIRRCCAMGEISGKNYVGGIVGSGCHVYHCYAYNDLQKNGESVGSIAGHLKKDGILCENYYVDGNVGGVDGISYQNGASPLSYKEFCSREEVPDAFSDFEIKFVLDGEEIASYHCRYGDKLTPEQIPEIPEKEGYYGCWPDYNFNFVTGNKILEAQYEKWTTTLESLEKKDDRVRVLVEGRFYPGMELLLKEEGNTVTVSVEDPESGTVYKDGLEVHVYCEDPQNVRVKTEEDGAFKETESVVKGSYVIFHMNQPGRFQVEESGGGNAKWYVIGGCALLAVTGTVWITAVRKRKRRGKKKEKNRNKEVEKSKD